MFTPTKIFLLIIILALVWFIFSAIEKRNRRAAEAKREEKAETVDLRQCTACGNWVDNPAASRIARSEVDAIIAIG